MQSQTLLFDGAMGTYLQNRYDIDLADVEESNLTHPHIIVEAHRNYLDAGAEAIHTNTYAANTVLQQASEDHILDIIDAACQNAKMAVAGTNARVYGCIGQIPGEFEETFPEYRRLIDRFVANGIRGIVFQSFSDPAPFLPLAVYTKEQDPAIGVICEGTVSPDGYSATGIPAQHFADVAAQTDDIDAIGFNCSCGPAHLVKIMGAVDWHGKRTIAIPNAGFPRHESGRLVYDTDPEYFASRLAAMAAEGVCILGGCCGTTPAHIFETAKQLEKGVEVTQTYPRISAPTPRAVAASLIPRTQPFIAVELDPPLDVSGPQRFFDDAVQIAGAGTDLLTIADCPVGRARADSSVLASMLRQKLGIDVMPHLTCRDRNLNASKALLLALHMADVENVLLVTGDPLPMAERERTRSVFHFNSVNYAGLVSALNDSTFKERPFRIMGAVNVNATNFDAELAKSVKKRDAGVSVLLSQPVMDQRARDNLQRAREELKIPILAGIMPIISYRNACFINNEMGGISIPQRMIDAYEGKSKEECSKLAVQFALEAADAIKDQTDGYYIITMLKRADISTELVKEIKQWS